MSDEQTTGVGAAATGPEILHVDDWVRGDMGFDDKPDDGDAMYARWLMLHWRLPAYMKNHFARFIADKKLFCTYELLRYRCIGGSRMGDVWLTTKFENETGYELRVDVSRCKAWSDSPNSAGEPRPICDFRKP
jgi:hypothetical protein